MNITKKSRAVAFILTLLLGPLGLLYASVLWGLVLIVVAILSAPTVVGPIACWVLSILIADSAVYGHNKNIDEFLKVMGK